MNELICPKCFIAEDKCQMDIHHKDVNNQNNDRSNLQLLCACCHRLISKTL